MFGETLKEQRFIYWINFWKKQKKSDLKSDCYQHRSRVDEEGPKFNVNASWIFEHENWKVFDYNEGKKHVQGMDTTHVPQEQLKVADGLAEWPKQWHRYLQTQSNCVVKQWDPEDRGRQSVHQGGVAVWAIFFIPE